MLMKVIDEILELFKEDREYFVEFKINSLGFTVYLDNDPQETFEEKYIIPIRYDSLYGCYIPDDEFREKMEENGVGITYEEVCLIKEIMKIMLECKDEIEEICDLCHVTRRGDKNDN